MGAGNGSSPMEAARRFPGSHGKEGGGEPHRGGRDHPYPSGEGGRLSSDFSVTPFSRSFRDAKRPWGFYQAVLRFGREADRHYELPGVVKTVEMAKRTGRDVHRWKGFLRFRLLGDGVFYAPFEPDHNVLPFLTAHFRKRLGDQEWMVHDLKRSIAALCREGRVGYARVEAPGWLLRSPSLRDARWLLRRRGGTLSRPLEGILPLHCHRESEESKLQRQFMPKKYQKYLLEKEELPGLPGEGLEEGL